ncbi:MAG TPA: DUF3310 domain-containing protein [Tissierellaceae bacterium]|nr:DUF3310 domain-containing protein [Tissierellaceae bacterium]
MKKLIYVCSPYSGDIEYNVEFARKASRFVVDQGHIPITPHLFLPQFISEETERELAMEINIELLEICDELWFFGDKLSDGMAYEIRFAKEHGTPTRNYTGLDLYDRYILTPKAENLLDKLSKGLDNVNHPSHYTFGQYEVLDVIEDWDLPFHLANVIKYIARAKHKGNEIQDLLKAQFYLNRYVDIKKTKEGEKYCEEID